MSANGPTPATLVRRGQEWATEAPAQAAQPALTPPCVPSQNFCYHEPTQQDLLFNPLCDREHANYRTRARNANASPDQGKIGFFEEQRYTEARVAPRGACCCGGGYCPVAAVCTAVWYSRAVRAGM